MKETIILPLTPSLTGGGMIKDNQKSAETAHSSPPLRKGRVREGIEI
jgi:hypothetical protein